MSIERPIIVREGEGDDRLKEGDDNTGSMVPVEAQQSRLFSRGSAQTRVTAASLFPSGLGDPEEIVAYSHLNPALQKAEIALRDQGRNLKVVSGFLSPDNQLARWRILYARRNPQTPWEEIQAGRSADSTGSVACIIENDVSQAALTAVQGDTALIEELRRQSGEQGDITPLLRELVQYRANATDTGVSIDPRTATSVHNLGHSVNAVLTDSQGEPMNMGVGIDIVSPAQKVDYFESATPADYEQLLAGDPLLAEYARRMGVTTVNETTLATIGENRRQLFWAMREGGFGFYKGEQGHFSLPRKNGNHPSRSYTYAQARAAGYTVTE